MHVSPDLQQARVYYTTLGDEKARHETARALGRATPFLRRQIGSRLRLKRVPELQFFFDESIEQSDRIERILKDIGAERAAEPTATPRRTRPTSPTATSRTTMSNPAPAGDLRRRLPQSPWSSGSATRSSRRPRFLITSHARPDGDSIGSQLAMAFALDALGKQVRIVNADRRARPLPGLPRHGAHRDRARARPTPTPTR